MSSVPRAVRTSAVIFAVFVGFFAILVALGG